MSKREAFLDAVRKENVEDFLRLMKLHVSNVICLPPSCLSVHDDESVYNMNDCDYNSPHVYSLVQLSDLAWATQLKISITIIISMFCLDYHFD